jgi:hypothetical protein
MGFLDKAKKMAEKAGPLIDKAAPHARTVVDKAGQQIDRRTGGKYHDKIEQVEHKVGEYADKRMGAGGNAPAAADEGFPPTPPPADTASGFPPTPPPATTPPADTPADTPAADKGDGFPTAAGSAEASGPAGTPTPGPDAPTDRPTP